MKKLIIAGAAVFLVALAGGGWFLFGRTEDPILMARAFLQKGDVRAAMIPLRNTVRDQPDNAEAHFLLAEAQLSQGDPVAAEKEAKSARDLNWDKALVTALLGQTYISQGKWKEVLDEVPAEAPTTDQTANFLVMRAVAQSAMNDMPAAKASLADAERLAPKSAEARMAAARFAISSQDVKLAEQKVDEALALDPKRADALLLKAQIKLAGGDRDAGLALFDQAVDAAPNLATPRLERANLLLTLGQDEKARSDVDAILAKEPRNPGAVYLSMILFTRAGKFVEADQLLQKLDLYIQRFPRGLYFQAMIKARLGQNEAAADAARRYVARAPRDRDGVRLLARIEIQSKRPAKAIEALTAAVASGQTDAETMDLLGSAYSLDGKRPEAVETFQKAAQLSPQNSAILTRLASSKMQLGDIAGATSALEKSLEITPTQAGAGEALVAASLSAGDLDRAQAALDRLREQAGETEAVGTLTGMIRLARLDVDGAREQFEAGVRKYPESPLAKLNLAKVLILQNRRAEAITLMKDALAKDRANTQVLTSLVQVLSQEKRDAEALAAVEAARTAAPGNLPLLAGYAELVARQGDPAKALTVLEGARVNGAMPAPLLPVVARLQVAAKRIDAAKATYVQMLIANPNDLEARRSQVELLVNAGDGEGAVRTLREGLRLSPGNLGMLAALVIVEQRAKGLEAAAALSDQLRSDPANMPAAGVLKGDLYVAARRFPEAAAAYAAEFKAAPSTPLAIRLANAETANGKQDQAYAALKAWQAKQPEDPDVAQTLASMEITAKKYPDAEKNLQTVLGKRPNDVIALNNMAWIYHTRGDGRARGMAQRAYLQAPTAETADTLGWILVAENEAAKGLSLLQQANAQRPEDRSVRYHMAVALKALDRRDEALALLRPLVDDAAEFDDKAAARQLLAQLTPAK